MVVKSFLRLRMIGNGHKMYLIFISITLDEFYYETDIMYYTFVICELIGTRYDRTTNLFHLCIFR